MKSIRETEENFINFLNCSDVRDLDAICERQDCEFEINDGRIVAVIFNYMNL